MAGCHHCDRELGPGELVTHDACTAEFNRREAEGLCVQCGEGRAERIGECVQSGRFRDGVDNLCRGCHARGGLVYRGYPGGS